jgi:hypothetical protein
VADGRLAGNADIDKQPIFGAVRGANKKILALAREWQNISGQALQVRQ